MTAASVFAMGGSGAASPQVKDRVSEDEWRTRVELAKCYRLVAHFGLTDGIYNHISCRVPGKEEHVLLNPFGLLYDEVTASSLVKVDLRSEEHTSELQSLMRISYAVFCLKKKKITPTTAN